jgi:hypothetical protein
MAVGLLSLISIATPAPAGDAAAEAWSIGEWEAAWTKVLSRYVDDLGRIDFDALRRYLVDEPAAFDSTGVFDGVFR